MCLLGKSLLGREELVLRPQFQDGRCAVEPSSADGERRLDSKSTLKIELTGFGDGLGVRSKREEFRVAARFLASQLPI